MVDDGLGGPPQLVLISIHLLTPFSAFLSMIFSSSLMHGWKRMA
jgi:hypothetical protein